MNSDQSERLFRYLDGKATPGERREVEELLRTDTAARDFLREVAEQSVMVADLERAQAGQTHELAATVPRWPRVVVPVRSRRWQVAAVAALLIVLLAVVVIQLAPMFHSNGIRVAKVTGTTQIIGARGEGERELEAGATLSPGDVLETLSIDAWVELELQDRSRMTVAGQSALRVLEDQAGGLRLTLLRGSLWVNPTAPTAAKPLIIQTPSALVEMKSARFDLHACSTETTLRVNDGTARVKQSVDGSEVHLSRGDQATASLDREGPLTAMPQPQSVNTWTCDLGTIPDISLGRWLPLNESMPTRLGTAPLLWPVPNREPVLLHVVSLSVLRSSERPVVLHSDSKLIFHSRTERPQKVRFGFSTQKMRGAFTGKFEVDVSPDTLAPAGKVWTVALPLSAFHPLDPKLSASPEGLELNDIYALTIREDAGLEIHRIELLPPAEGP